MNEERNNLSKVLEHVLFYPAITAIGYAMALLYEIIILSRFNIPIEYIEIKPSSYFLLACAFVTYLTILFATEKATTNWQEISSAFVIGVLISYGSQYRSNIEDLGAITSFATYILTILASWFVIKIGKRPAFKKDATYNTVYLLMLFSLLCLYLVLTLSIMSTYNRSSWMSAEINGRHYIMVNTWSSSNILAEYNKASMRLTGGYVIAQPDPHISFQHIKGKMR